MLDRSVALARWAAKEGRMDGKETVTRRSDHEIIILYNWELIEAGLGGVRGIARSSRLICDE